MTTFTWDFVSAPGVHTITAAQGSGANQQSAQVSLTVRRGKTPRFLVYPRVAPPATNVHAWLAGFPANSNQQLGLYRQRLDCTAFPLSGSDCYELASDLGTIKIGGDGSAARTIQVPANEPTVAHLVTTANLHISDQNPFDTPSVNRITRRPRSSLRPGRRP